MFILKGQTRFKSNKIKLAVKKVWGLVPILMLRFKINKMCSYKWIISTIMMRINTVIAVFLKRLSKW